MKVYGFPGQGSQARGMGGTLFEKYRELTGTASALLGYSIEELCLRDPQKRLDKTQYTQPALYVVGALAYVDAKEQGREADYLIGHSLGELSALFAAGRTFAFALSGYLAKDLGYANYYWLTAALALPGLALLPRIRDRLSTSAGSPPTTAAAAH